MHKTIKRFGMEGIIRDDSDFARLREQYEMLVIQNMRDIGYVPVLDLGTYWSTSRRDDESYNFQLSIYGVKIGKDKSWMVEGMVAGRETPRPTLPIK